MAQSGLDVAGDNEGVGWDQVPDDTAISNDAGDVSLSGGVEQRGEGGASLGGRDEPVLIKPHTISWPYDVRKHVR
jgi:hypothetical protein